MPPPSTGATKTGENIDQRKLAAIRRIAFQFAVDSER
jgi:hypothetical protein